MRQNPGDSSHKGCHFTAYVFSLARKLYQTTEALPVELYPSGKNLCRNQNIGPFGPTNSCIMTGKGYLPHEILFVGQNFVEQMVISGSDNSTLYNTFD